MAPELALVLWGVLLGACGVLLLGALVLLVLALRRDDDPEPPVLGPGED